MDPEAFSLDDGRQIGRDPHRWGPHAPGDPNWRRETSRPAETTALTALANAMPPGGTHRDGTISRPRRATGKRKEAAAGVLRAAREATEDIMRQKMRGKRPLALRHLVPPEVMGFESFR